MCCLIQNKVVIINCRLPIKEIEFDQLPISRLCQKLTTCRVYSTKLHNTFAGKLKHFNSASIIDKIFSTSLKNDKKRLVMHTILYYDIVFKEEREHSLSSYFVLDYVAVFSNYKLIKLAVGQFSV